MSSNPSPPYVDGQVVPKTFDTGFIVLSYVISWVGAWTALELLNKRTSGRGIYNWYLLVACSISMGGVAIFSMHFLGNRAIILGDGQSVPQLSYNDGITTISFFLPLLVLLGAFITAGSNEKVSLLRVGLGGTLTGLATLGMHFVAESGISCYTAEYMPVYVVGAGIVAVVATTAALALFFILRASWTASWWKRALTAVLISGAMSSTHWVAEFGTSYRLKDLDDPASSGLSQNWAVIVGIVLSISSCLLLLITSFLAQRRRALSANRAEQVALAVAIFDRHGRLLVTPEGLLPNQKITNSYIERSFDDVFGISHPVFLWIFRTTRNWGAISSLLPLMRNHINLATLPKGLRSGSAEPSLATDSGEPIEDYSLIFRELFCVAASDLADQLNEPLEQVGVLFDEILRTGQRATNKIGSRKRSRSSSVDLERDGVRPSLFGRGQLLFLTRRASPKEVENLQNSGFRFADVHNVVDILARSMQINVDELNAQITNMHDYATETQILERGVHLAYFAIRANVRGGFDVLVRKDARSQLPTMTVPLPALDEWHLEYLSKLDGMSAAACLKLFKEKILLPNIPQREQDFLSKLGDTLRALRDEIKDPLFLDALLIAAPVRAPCRALDKDAAPGEAPLITFRLIVPIHSRAPSDKLEFVPLSFFKAQQHVYANSPAHAVFARKIHREFGPILNQSRPSVNEREGLASPSSFKLDCGSNKSLVDVRTELEHRLPTLIPRARPESHGPLRFWRSSLKPPEHLSIKTSSGRLRDDASSEKNLVEATSFGGILVSQEITVKITDAVGSGPRPGKSAYVEMMRLGHKGGIGAEPDAPADGRAAEMTRMGTLGVATTETEDPETFVDALFAVCVETR